MFSTGGAGLICGNFVVGLLAQSEEAVVTRDKPTYEWLTLKRLTSVIVRSTLSNWHCWQTRTKRMAASTACLAC
jgi:hypothetical protein